MPSVARSILGLSLIGGRGLLCSSSSELLSVSIGNSMTGDGSVVGIIVVQLGYTLHDVEEAVVGGESIYVGMRGSGVDE